MAQTIKLKRSATQGATPTTSQLALGEVAINTYDGKMYIKKDVGGTESIVEITAGSGGTGGTAASAILVEYQFTATASQTTFTGSDDNSETLSYTANAIQVFLNGILLDSATDYTATNGTSVVLTSAAALNDYIQIVAFKKKIGDGNVSVDTFTGDDSTVAFTLSVDPGDENNTRVFIDGVYQSKSNYSVSGTTLTFSTAPPTDTAVEVEIGNRVVTLDTLSDLDLPDDVKLRLGTDQDLEIFHDGTRSIINDAGTGDLQFQVGGSAIFDVTTDGIVMEGFPESDYELRGDLDGGIRFTAQAGEALSKGDIVYISGAAGDNTIVSKAQANSSSTMPAFGFALANTSNGASCQIVTFGNLYGSGGSPLNTSAFTVGDTLYVSATTAGAFTNTPPTGESNLLQNIGKVVRSASSNGVIKVGGAGRTNAVPNLDDGDIFLGNSSNQAVSASLNTKIEEYLDSGVSTPTFAGLATTADVSFGDNDKAIFGAGNDLQIYHDGSNSYVQDLGTGKLILKSNGTATLIQDASGGALTEFHAVNKQVKLFYDNSLKLATTSTGIDVTGSVTADGGTFDGAVLMNSSNELQFFNTNYGIRASTGLEIKTGDFTRFLEGSTEHMRIASGGNVGIGTTSPSSPLTVNGTITIGTGTGTYQAGSLGYSDSNWGFLYRPPQVGALGAHNFQSSAGSTLMVVADSGNVGISNPSPDTLLHIGNINATNATHQGRIKLEDLSSSLNTAGGLEFVTSAFGSGYGWKINSVDSSGGVHLDFGTRQNSTTWSNSVRFMGDGRVAIGDTTTDNTANRLKVKGTQGDDRIAMSTASTTGNATIEAQVANYWTGPTYTGTGIVQYDSASSGTTAGISNANLGMLRFQNGSAGLILTNGATPIHFATAGTNRMTLDASGNVGIGVSSPAKKLDVGAVAYAANQSGGIRIADTGGNWGMGVSARSDGSGQPRLSLDDANGIETLSVYSSKVGIGTTTFTDNYKTIIEGSDQETANLTDSGTHGATLFLRATGENAGSGGAVAFGTTFGNKRPFAAIKGYALDGTANSIGDLAFSTRATTSATNLTERMRLSANGRLGLGTDNPAGKFVSVADSQYGIAAQFQNNGDAIGWARADWYNNNASGSGIIYRDQAGSFVMRNDNSSGTAMTTYIVAGGTTAGHIAFNTTSSSEAMRVESSGEVGIGTATPSAKLHVYTATTNNIIKSHSGSGYAAFQALASGTNSSYIFFNNASGETGRIASANGGTMVFYNNGTQERMRIDGSGNLGINNSSPDSTLNVKGQAKFGDIADSSQLRLNSSTSAAIVESNVSNGLILRSNAVGSLSHIVFNTNGTTEAMRIRHDQIVLIGTSASLGAGGLTVRPNITQGAAQINFNRATTTNTSFAVVFQNAGSDVGSISYSNTVVAYNTSSDQRLKENIVDAPSASDDIDAIQVRSFDWKADGSHQKYGMVAQELQTVAPDAVSEGDTEEEMMGVDYSKLVPMLVKALQESKQEINNLKSRVEQLEKQ